MSTIIGIATIKGGAGKSTLAANLVGWLVNSSKSTLLVDCDEPANRTSSSWIAEAIPAVPIRLIQDADELWDQLPRLRSEAEYVIVDTPGTSEMIRQTFMRADIALIPTKAGKAEADPLVASVRILRQAQEIRHGRPRAHVVLSQVGKRFRNTRAMKELAAKLGLPLTESALYFTPRHSEACDLGTFVWCMGAEARSYAADLDQLFFEILPEVDQRIHIVNS
jgi:cellulose biosynthesis protein BcsQ